MTYEPLPAVIGMTAARAPGAPEVYAGGRRRPPTADRGTADAGAVGTETCVGPSGCSRSDDAVPAGCWPSARAEGDPLLVEGRPPYRGPAAHGVRAARRGGAVVWRRARPWMCRHRPLRTLPTRSPSGSTFPANSVRVRAEHVGGGFGAKQDLTPETVAAISLARAAGAPVRLALDRLEELSVTGYRPAARSRCRCSPARDARPARAPPRRLRRRRRRRRLHDRWPGAADLSGAGQGAARLRRGHEHRARARRSAGRAGH